MTDVVDRQTRSRMMSGIKSKNTKPEVEIRKKLFALGYRYQLHSHKVFGKPDLVFSKLKAVIFVDGCFWHGHYCHLFKWPQSRTEFWEKKIKQNIGRDKKVNEILLKDGWRVLRIYECAIKGKRKWNMEDIIKAADRWLQSQENYGEIVGVEKE